MESRERVVTALMAAGLDRELIAHVMEVVDEYAHERYQDGVCDGEQSPERL